MKKYLFTLGITLLFTLNIWAQTPAVARQTIRLGNKLVEPGTFWGDRNISRVLNKRLNLSFQRAYEVQNQCLPNMIIKAYAPSKSMSHNIKGSVQELYPHAATFLTTKKQLTLYFLARNNREFINVYPKFQQMQQQIRAHIPDFQASIVSTGHPQTQDLKWIAEQLPKNLDYFLIGEAHFYPEIRQAVSNLIHEVRLQFPQRRIFLFTEFMLDGDVYPSDNFREVLPQYTTIWQAAVKEGITPVGLELSALGPSIKTAQISSRSGTGLLGISTMHKTRIGATLEGIRLRNRHWLQILKDYKQKYPDALFIVYAGAWHVEYNHPYSLAKVLQSHANVFETSLYPIVNLYSSDCSLITSTFDRLTDGKFPQRVLQFNDQNLKHLAGFDVQVKIPVFPRGD